MEDPCARRLAAMDALPFESVELVAVDSDRTRHRRWRVAEARSKWWDQAVRVERGAVTTDWVAGIPSPSTDPGRTGGGKRLFMNGCLWVLRSGTHWCDLPERYAKWKTVNRRFSRCCHASVWERVFKALTANRNNQYLIIDNTVVRAHQEAATKRGAKIRR